MTAPARPGAEDRPSLSLRRISRRRPLATMLTVSIVLTLTVQVWFLLSGWNVFPAKLLELVLLVGGSTVVTAWIGGRVAVRRLFAGLARWRIGTRAYLLVLLAMPLLTIGVAAATR